MNRIKSFFHKYIYYIFTILLAMLVIVGIFYLQDIAPFGNNSLLTIDFYHQYGPMMAELRERLAGGTNLIYSFNMGMGLPFFRNFFNYLSSPFNIILLLFKQSNLLTSYNIIIGFKMVFSALTMGIYLRKKFGKNYLFIGLSILYAFCAYFTAYYWNIMWLDGLVMLPLIILGIENIVNKNKGLLYVFSLAVMLWANYFIGYMICIFSVIYFIGYLIIKSNKLDFKVIGKKCLRFIVYSLLAGLLCAAFLIPLYYALKEISATGDVFPNSQYYAFTFKEFIFNHFSGVGSTVLKSGITNAPNISVGIIPIGLLFLFIINPKIKLKIKIVYIGMLLVLLFSFIIGKIDFIWHAFHVPNDLPYRYSFIYSFILIVIAAYSINSIKDIKRKYVLIVYLLLLIFIKIMELVGFNNINHDMIILNYILITIGYLCYIIAFYFNKRTIFSRVVFVLVLGLESILVVNNNWNIDLKIRDFYSNYDDVSEKISYINNKDNGVYRIEKDHILTFNDPSWYNYYGLVTFSSMEYENMAVTMNHLGMPGNEINSFYYKENTPIFNMMFNLKYIIGNVVDSNSFIKDDIYNINESKYSIGLLYGVNKDVVNWKNNFVSPFKNQNDFIYKASGVDCVFEKVNFNKIDIIYENNNKTIVKYVVNSIDEVFYTYFRDYDIDFVIVNNTLYYLNDDYAYSLYSEIDIDNYIDYNERFVIANNDNKIEIFVGYDYYSDDEIELYKLNRDKLNKVYNSLNSNKVNITSFKEYLIEGTVDIDDDMVIYSSIPYDNGWHVYVDGKKVDKIKLGNSLLGFNVDKGKHNIKLIYHIPYLYYGLGLSGISLLVIVILIKKNKI